MSARLWLVRHGRIEANVSGHWHGSTDSPLDDVGHRQIEAAGRWFAGSGVRFEAVYTSPLQRTRHTAEAIARALALDIEARDDLREYGIGTLEGTPYADLMVPGGFMERMRNDPQWAPEAGESLRDVVNRMRCATRAIAQAHPHGEVVVVSHGAAMGLLLGELLHDDPLAWRNYHVANCSVTELRLEPEAALGRFNCTEHLEGIG